MKKTLSAVLVLSLAAATVSAQGLFSANLSGTSELPPNSSQSIGTGSFSLGGQNFSYTVSALLMGGSIPVDAGVFGPATPAQVGPMIFDLGVPVLTPVGGNLFATYSGVATLTPTQVTEVTADLTYVNVVTQQYPAGEIRGQITLLPEPSSALLLGMGAGIVWLARRKKA